LRETTHGTVLAGLISGFSGESPAFTGVYHYRSWLLSQIHQADSSQGDSTP
jgi:hypothetical protein